MTKTATAIGELRTVALSAIHVEKQFNPRDDVGGLPEPPQPPRGGAPASDGHRGDDPLLRIPPDVYVRRLLGV